MVSKTCGEFPSCLKYYGQDCRKRENTKGTLLSNQKARTLAELFLHFQRNHLHPQFSRSMMHLPPFQPSLNIQPKTPDKQPEQYHITLLKCCHANTSTCYGCIRKFIEVNAPPLLPPNDMVIVLKTRRIYFDGESKVYYLKIGQGFIFISLKGVSFYLILVFVPEDLKPFLTVHHVNIICSSGIYF